MYVILVYDISERKVTKVLKLCRRYLTWIQNSVFEGELTELQLERLKAEASEIIDPETDSMIFFSSRSEKWLDKEVLGRSKNSPDIFL